MTRFDKLRHKVAGLYEQKLASRDGWTDWIYPNHVLIVAKNAKTLAKRKDADVELAQVAALLHDVADYKMKRSSPEHEEESLKTAREVMQACGYNAEEILLVVDDAIRHHGCHGGIRPKSKEGLILSAADALAHFQTDYYVFATRNLNKDMSVDDVKKWALTKIERDLYDKIAFDDVRGEVRPDYELIKELFGR